jgi:hypothetical protein
MPRWTGVAGTCAAALLALVMSGCATSIPPGMAEPPPWWAPQTNFRGKPASTVVDWLGEPDIVRRVSPDLLLYEWYDRDRLDPGYPDPGLLSETAFFVRPNGTVVGPALSLTGVCPTGVDEIVAILGPPTRLKHYRFFDAYAWKPRKKPGEPASGVGTPVLEMRLSLSVDKGGWVRSWS